MMTADILPTICAATGVDLPGDRVIDGRNALPIAVSGAPSAHGAVYWANGHQLAVRQGKWKLVVDGIVYDATPEGNNPLQGDDAVFLSNLDDDPGESRNLRHQHPDIIDRLSTAAHQWQKDAQGH